MATVEKGKPTGFAPITVILETQAEADTFYHRMNMAQADFSSSYSSRKDFVKYDNKSYDLYDLISKVYEPKGR